MSQRQSKGLARNWLRKLGWGESGGRAKQAEGQGKPESVPGARSGAQLTAAVGGPRLQSIPSPSICPQRASLPNQTPQVPACRRDCITGFALSVGARDVIKIWCFFQGAATSAHSSTRTTRHQPALSHCHRRASCRRQRPRCAALRLIGTLPRPLRQIPTRENRTRHCSKHRPPSDSDDTRADADASRFSRHGNTPQRHRISSIPGA